MVVVGAVDQFFVLVTISVLFTVLSIGYSKSVILGLLAGISWIISALGTFVVGDQTSPLTVSLSLLFMAFAIIFLVKTVIQVASSLGEKREKRYSTEL